MREFAAWLSSSLSKDNRNYLTSTFTGTLHGFTACRDKYFVITSFISSASIIAARNKCAGVCPVKLCAATIFSSLALSKRIKRTINNDVNNKVSRTINARNSVVGTGRRVQLCESYRHLVEAICWVKIVSKKKIRTVNRIEGKYFHYFVKYCANYDSDRYWRLPGRCCEQSHSSFRDICGIVGMHAAVFTI